ncbi:17466_t:CDS:2 [Dentiscutata erythropus]|uniref:17466_t:CDS:1 n=1 Tax=Dentiscutata erythropus TaxID=1348616 RepID=A0A9N9DWC2_9GLOM|nr:17466_t:CDS:2 [Dentiscutata erythropus]
MSSTHLAIRSDLASNRCPLKVSLVGVAQGSPKEINSENAVVNVLVNDYAGQSILFVVGQIEIIDKDLYVYAADISFVDISPAAKKKVFAFESLPAVYRSVSSRLLTVHQSINEKSFNTSEIKNIDLSKEKSKCEDSSTSEDFHVMKRTRLEDENVDYSGYVEFVNNIKMMYNYGSSGCSSEGSFKGKDKAFQSVVHNTRQRSKLSKNSNSNDEKV